MRVQNTQAGIWLMIAAVFVLAVQDGFSKQLATGYGVFMIVMLRYWFFAGFVVLQALTHRKGFRAAVQTRHLWLHIARAVLLIGDICLMVLGFTKVGLINAHAVFAVCPLLIAALAVPILGEKVGWRRWLAIFAGLTGVVIILQPDQGVFSPDSLLPLGAAVLFALYSLLTRLATRDEPAFVSLFWSGVIGAVLISALGLPQWVAMPVQDWALTGVYASLSLLGHFLLIRCYDAAEASAVQPFAYLQIVFVSLIGVLVFSEAIRMNVLAGVAIVISAGLFTLWRQRQTD
jgi:drug/metabolite transporter (DMT)-like permease